MAYRDKPAASLIYNLVDASNSQSQMQFHVPTDTAADVALAAALVLAPLMEAVTGCAITGYNLTYSQFNDSPETPTAGSRVERRGVFQFLTDAGKKALITVPGIIDAAVLEDGRIDDDNVAVAAFYGAIVAADAIFCDSNGSNLISLLEAYERFSSTTKTQAPVYRKPD